MTVNKVILVSHFKIQIPSFPPTLFQDEDFIQMDHIVHNIDHDKLCVY